MTAKLFAEHGAEVVVNYANHTKAAPELGPLNITANVLTPAMVETDATKHTPVEQKEQVEMSTPLGRIAKPKDIACSVLYFAGD
ncbi:SDR family oxidoreductase [Bacillus sp. BP-3]|uniref:SDR family oxidoreductase n=1 Tax=Bacillus sp. BP-3 TaxID=3022773 RepID=UPI00232BB8C1|nr:SDR family oxidoreductase [Bacillus sp. BP-3]MDC2865101.1 SDR family oxidoreductase [Bacillus sp. BP-3]